MNFYLPFCATFSGLFANSALGLLELKGRVKKTEQSGAL
jgi:hypothetical protein